MPPHARALLVGKTLTIIGSGLLLLGSVACTGSDSEPAEGESLALQVMGLGKGQNASGDSDESVSGGVSVVDATSGEPVMLPSGKTKVSVSTRLNAASDWLPASDIVLDQSSPVLLDVMLVADNSGSVVDSLPDIKDALSHFAHILLARSDDDRVGLVRVSSEASLIEGLTPDLAVASAAIDQMFINKGWTALWDGVRVANEVLEQGQVRAGGNGSTCLPHALPGIVVITDGRENNSSDQSPSERPGDGINTTFDDLVSMRVGSRATTIHTIGVGENIDKAELEALAERTGGKYANINNYGKLLGALHSTASELTQLVPLCFTPASCNHLEARITVEIDRGKTPERAEVVVALPGASCD